MNKVKCLEEIYRVYWESLQRDQIIDIEKWKNFKTFWFSFIVLLVSYLLLLFSNNIESSFKNILAIPFVFIFFFSQLFPYFKILFIIKNKSWSFKKKFLYNFMLYKTFNIFDLTKDQYNEFIEYLNVLIKEVPSREESQTIRETFSNIFYERNKSGEFKALYVNSKFLSFEEYSDYIRKNMFKIAGHLNISNKDYSAAAESDLVYSVVDEYKNNLDNFLYKYFQRKEKSFKGYFLEHLNYGGEQDIGFFWFSLILPLSPKWKLDTIKTILNSCRIQLGFKDYSSLGSDSIKNRKKSLIEKELLYFFIHKQKIAEAFAGYSEDQFKKIFIKNHSSEEIIKTISLVLKIDLKILPVLKSWHEIHHFVDNYSKTYKIPSNYLALDSYQGQFEYSTVKSYAELGEMAQILRNCLRSRHEKIMTGISFIVKIKKNKEIYGAIEISNGKIIEIAGHNNSKIQELNQIHKELQLLKIVQ